VTSRSEIVPYFTWHNVLSLSLLSKMAGFHTFYSQIILHAMQIYHIFFIHSSIHGHLGYFHLSAIVSNAVPGSPNLNAAAEAH
jgi:hypothetical protein